MSAILVVDDPPQEADRVRERFVARSPADRRDAPFAVLDVERVAP
ncbi:MAG: hypothetical protein ACRDL2_02950 [Gaiellaceae bacterium]